MALEKATLTNLLSGDTVPVRFNPEEYTIEASNNFAEIPVPGLPNQPLQYVRGVNRTLAMELFFDTYEAGRDVRQETGRITALLAQDFLLRAPPALLFAWGGLTFRCVLETVSQRFTMFRDDGTPVRATLSVRFKESQPTELLALVAGAAQETLRLVGAGDTLSGIAGNVLGDPGAWRRLADANNIDNPRRLAVGAALVVPPLGTGSFL